jgi:hypothetical protein
MNEIFFPCRINVLLLRVFVHTNDHFLRHVLDDHVAARLVMQPMFVRHLLPFLDFRGMVAFELGFALQYLILSLSLVSRFNTLNHHILKSPITEWVLNSH